MVAHCLKEYHISGLRVWIQNCLVFDLVPVYLTSNVRFAGMKLIARGAWETIHQYRLIFPAVGIVGPRQSGKTTLAKEIMREATGSVVYFDLERQADYAATAQVDLFLDSLNQDLIIIDEIQRRPELFTGLRSAIDANRAEGRFVLLGSASPEMMRDSSESLAGRIGYVELPPLNLLEVDGHYAQPAHWRKGGFPNSLRLDDEASDIWRENFIRTYLERDIRDLRPNIDAGALGRMLPMLAHLHGQSANYSLLAKSLSISSVTVRRYLELLEASFFLRIVPPYFTNLRKRLVKAPKLLVRDSGLLHTLLGVTTSADLLRHPQVGPSWEGYVIEQICQTLQPADEVYYYRSADQAELDLVIQRRGDPKPIAIEVKLSDQPTLSKGNYEAISAVEPGVTYIITPNAHAMQLVEGIELRSLKAFLEGLQR